MTTKAPNDRQSQTPRGLADLLRKATLFCDETMVDPKLTKALDRISERADDLTKEQREELLQIAQLIAATGNKSVKSLTRDATFELHESSDRMFLSLSVKPAIADGKPVQLADVVTVLKDRGITMGVVMPELQKALKSAAEGTEIVDVMIVRGRPPESGRDARMEFFARGMPTRPLDKVNPDQLAGKGGIGLMCVKDDVIARYHPPEPGKPGFTATGESLPSDEPADVEMEPGGNVRREGDEFISDITGMLQFDGKVLAVRPVLMFPKDVMASDGAIDFDGEVIVRGSIRSGVRMKATGSITVEGTVEAAYVESSGRASSAGTVRPSSRRAASSRGSPNAR